MIPLVPVLIGLLVTAGVGGGATVALDVAYVPAGSLGLVYGIYTWTLIAYPEARRFHFDALDGDDRWVAAALFLVLAAMLGLAEAFDVEGGGNTVLFLASVGGFLAATTLGGLIGDRGGFEERELP